MLTIRIEMKTFAIPGQGQGRTVFRDFALDVPHGQVCVIAGPSGVGKSTLLSIVAGTDREFRGVVEGRALPVGMMFQTPRLLPWLTVLRNVELVIPGREQEASRWVAAVGLEDHANEYPQRLSGGMARRVALARALAVEPALLLLDEPFASLDEATANTMSLLLREVFNTRPPIALIVTHNLAQVSSLADRFVVLEGSPAAIVRDVGIARGGGPASPRGPASLQAGGAE
ncbi:ATP-binding cassette domain-containing protein [Mesorhizobium sp. B2-5-4]|uniref:ABC transporter ATP-binding protein n=1 Tax=unclassified Mesorhizobium TaxID=325217 RepID=UPI001128C9D2|nr:MULTISPECIES: ATP-binding cassette domain-containing protein [unclassified Mesorhizobium]TPJ39979.1 ATP-binding cassette domain-containing protein [Mesorhizobium sp. B2-6-5]TPJ88073.1 ATP-binding cassette domain-containing protein [Mesorhizobium sp. B2-5-13]TPK44810.1 ATP-binding cassette domain-containing protein [Mesorhizobium sp. B2-5-4]TPK52268.1 ATP-binding cassette domain-containing protein [Mesorhizobium sp. B2-5-5]TPL94284.1 ATP-binding cassette domain-containing protein [Mesorhizob